MFLDLTGGAMWSHMYARKCLRAQTTFLSMSALSVLILTLIDKMPESVCVHVWRVWPV